MKWRAYSLSVLAVVALCATGPGTCREMSRAANGWKSIRNGENSSERAIVSSKIAPGDHLHIIFSTTAGADSEERARWQELAWLTMPELPTRGTEFDPIPEIADYVLAPDGNGHVPVCCPSNQWRKVGSCSETTRGLWERIGRLPTGLFPREKSCQTLSRAKEFLGMIPVFLLVGTCLSFGGFFGLVAGLTSFSALMFLPPLVGIVPGVAFVCGAVGLTLFGYFLFTRRFRILYPDKERIFILAIAVLLFAFYGYLALSHSFLVPNGFAVVGGKAKMWMLGSDTPSVWFADHSWTFLVPAYPPGFATIVLSCFAVSGGCGSWLTQLIGCSAMVLVFLSAAYSSYRGQIARVGGTIWLLSLFLQPIALKMGTQLYPDSLTALCIVSGWNLLWSGNERSRQLAWFVFGVAGWFKNEGLLFAIFSWLAWMFAGGGKRKDETWLKNACHSFWRHVAKTLPAVAAGLALPFIWQIFVWSLGGALPEYAPLWKPDFHQMLAAFILEWKTILFHPWNYGFAYPAVFLIAICRCLMLRVERRIDSGRESCSLSSPDEICAIVVFVMFCLVCIPWIYGCSRSADFEWHLLSSLPRLLWTPAIVSACAAIRWLDCSRDSTGIR